MRVCKFIELEDDSFYSTRRNTGIRGRKKALTTKVIGAANRQANKNFTPSGAGRCFSARVTATSKGVWKR